MTDQDSAGNDLPVAIGELIKTHKVRPQGRPPKDTPPPPKPPGPVIRMGKSLTLRSCRSGAGILGMHLNGFTRMLKAMRVPLIALGTERYFNEAVLELGLFIVTYFKQRGYAAPGSDTKNQGMDPLPSQLPKSFPRKDQISEALVAFRKMASAKSKASDDSIKRLLKDKTSDILRDAEKYITP